MQGHLYVVGTPIGNIEDITYRAVSILDSVDIIVCEDKRVTSRLINILSDSDRMSNKPKYFTYNDHNAREKYKEVVSFVSSGKKVALVSDSGMPVISDPGYRVIRECYDLGLPVTVVPGVSSVSSAVVSSGLGGQEYLFFGFLHKKDGKRRKQVERIKEVLTILEDVKIVLFVTPHRVEKDIMVLKEVLGDRVTAVLMREMTKKHEERIEGSLPDILDNLTAKPRKGEMVLIIKANDQS